ncbi:MAG: hypothetical protein II816_03725 [Elusimicrobia bacterium]|nr:hypothetical protein [Elusimicrobiota bacterium]
MDLIYATGEKVDIGVMNSFKFDLAFGIDENNFELTTSTNNHVCREGYILYIEDTEYGGIIRKIAVNTQIGELLYKGDTWHGIIAKKILEPDAGEDYLICDGEANSVLSSLIERMGLDDLFKASTDLSLITIRNYKMNRYIDGYSGIKKMLAAFGGKLKLIFQDGFVILSAEPLADYSQDDEFDSSQIDFDIEKNYKPTNHVICLGRGELAERTVIHLFTDSEGNISHTQSLFGLDEITLTYENANCESDEELENGGIELLKAEWNTDKLQINFDSTKTYDIGDIVGARENVTGIFMAKEIVKKIVSIDDETVTISHKVGE